jgi:NADP-dependent 3-hydroxy acid dehydrogenase YdfG
MKDLTGKVAVVTGAASGIGAALAAECAGNGAVVYLCDRDTERLEPVVATLREAHHGSVSTLTCDVTDRAAMLGAADSVFERSGRVDLLFLNAGVGLEGRIDELRGEDWDWVLGINLGGAVNGLLAFLPRMRIQPSEKHVVFSASMAGVAVSPGGRRPVAAYIAAKHALVGIADQLAAEGAGYSLGVTVLCPGSVRTRLHETTRLVGSAAERDTATPGTAPVSPDEVARATIDAIRNGYRYVATDASLREWIEPRYAALSEAFDRAGSVAS